jgi:hypothetical protein
VDNGELANRFTVHPPKSDQEERYQEIRTAAHSLAALLVYECPQSRELDLALIRLEESMFWANSAIARRE